MARNALVPLALYTLLASNRSGLWTVFFPLFLVESRGASEPFALALLSAAFVASSLLGPIAGRWSDRLGRRRPFLLGAEAGALPLFLAVPFLPTALSAGLVFVAAMAVLSLGAPALSAYVADITGERGRGRGFGLLNAVAASGGIAGFFIAAFLSEAFGYPSLFFFTTAVMVGTVLVLLTLVAEGSPVRPAVRTSPREYRSLAVFSVAVSVRSLGVGAVGTFYGLYAISLGATPLGVSLIAVAGMAALALASVPGGRYVDRAGEIRGIWLGTLLTLGGIVLFLVADQWYFLIPAQGVRSLGLAFLSPGMLAYVANRAPAGRRAEHLGIFSLVNSTFWSVGPLIGGILLAVGGSVALLGFALAVTLVSLAAIELLYVPRRRSRGNDPVPRMPGSPGPPAREPPESAT